VDRARKQNQLKLRRTYETKKKKHTHKCGTERPTKTYKDIRDKNTSDKGADPTIIGSYQEDKRPVGKHPEAWLLEGRHPGGKHREGKRREGRRQEGRRQGACRAVGKHLIR
jgi:hypothetical protein